jgi:hypothetical protein
VFEASEFEASGPAAGALMTQRVHTQPRYAALRLDIAGVAIAAAFTLFALIGIFRRYSPIPLLDDFPGYIEFNLDVLEGKVSAWWAMWDVDVPIVGRVLYWLDFRFFSARFIFLIGGSIAILIGVFGVIALYAKHLVSREFLPVLLPLLLAMTFAWMQAPNLWHGFNGAQWFPNMLFPLAGFYCVHLATKEPRYFWFAALLGVFSVGTLANGLLVLPIMAALAAVIGLGAGRVVLLVGLFIVCAGLYFLNFQLHPAELSAPLTLGPISIAAFTLVYLGAPFYYVVAYWLAGLQHAAGVISGTKSAIVTETLLDYSAAHTAGVVAAGLAGAVFTVASLAMAIRWQHKRDTCQTALFGFLAFIAGTAAMTAIGRAKFGIDYAPQARYMTASLLGWQAFAILLLAQLDRQHIRIALVAMFVVVSIGFLPDELRTLIKSSQLEEAQRELFLKALQTGESDNPDVARVAKRIKAEGLMFPR